MSPHVLLVDDEPRFRALYAQVLRAAGFVISEAADVEEALARLGAEPVDMVVSDVRMPGASGIDLLELVRARGDEVAFLLVTAWTDVRDAVAALKLGAVDYLSKPVDLDELVACVQDTLGVSSEAALADDPPAALKGDIIAVSEVMRGVLRDAWRFARSDVNVLLRGESGTGKELMASFVHRASERAGGPFVAVNCAALPPTLLESELFGHERGAFTGATTARKGRFREAAGGVLFLDEIGDMPLDMQPVLLRALEQRTIRPVGASGDVRVDFRLVAATNSDLEALVAAGRFRADLYYRLNVIALDIPPLRERADDILPLARHLLAASDGPSKRIGSAAARLLQSYEWPGNVRELANAMKRARLLSRTDVILPESLPPTVQRARSTTPAPAPAPGSHEPTGGTPEPVETLERTEIASLRRALEATGGNRTHAAELLGISRRGLLKKLKRFGLQGDPP
ncbi:MAG: sigma-54-dependent Fis family transcriptional regulator [Deltaproteobacteria bacterium HGW-Deltaproteobacteria-14]|nr:MAG: sigma-54-dependent Fis family transcriptional regulator [Deltaproteobacteria bacterium HGW-Deltaproteobacteria-14]